MRKERPNTVTFFNENLLNKPTSDFAYFLGFFWADGFFGNANEISIEINSKDCENLKSIFDSVAKFSYYNRERKSNTRNYKSITKLYLSSKLLKNYLIKYNFKDKSTESFEYILNSLDKDLQKHFIRGYFDGDGCVYVNKKNSLYQVSFSSSFNQDWKYLKKYFFEKNIQFSEIQREHKSKETVSFSSIIRISTKQKCIDFYNLFIKNTLGLERKLEKFKQIV